MAWLERGGGAPAAQGLLVHSLLQVAPFQLHKELSGVALLEVLSRYPSPPNRRLVADLPSNTKVNSFEDGGAVATVPLAHETMGASARDAETVARTATAVSAPSQG